MRIRRNKTEQIEDAFMDLSPAEQVAMLESLAKLRRWAERMRQQQVIGRDTARYLLKEMEQDTTS